MKKLLLLALACIASQVVQAQTGRIALASHAGWVAGPAATADNLGLPSTTTEWRQDSLVCTSESRMEHRGETRSWRYNAERERAVWQRRVEVYGGSLDKGEMRDIRRRYPNAVFIKPAQAKKLKSQPPASRTQSFQRRPFQYSYWRELTGVVVVGAVGWLLGKKRPV